MNKIAAIKEVYYFFDKRIGLRECKEAVEHVLDEANKGIPEVLQINDVSEAMVNDVIYWIRQGDPKKRVHCNPDQTMLVTVLDKREFPDYKNVQITTLVRELLNSNGLNWEACLIIGTLFQEAIENADYLSDDVGRTWAMSFVPKGENNARKD